jgi:hypothetical protein
MCRGGTRACAHSLDFQYKNFSYSFFVVKIQPLYENFSIPPCGNWCFSQGSTPPVDIKFCEYVSNSLRNKNWKRLIPNLLEKVIYLASKTLQSPLGTWKKTFFSTLKVMISQMVRNGCLIFGVHVDIQVSYKILWLEIPKNVLILH